MRPRISFLWQRIAFSALCLPVSMLLIDWYLIRVAFALAAAPWIVPWSNRFSLCTLLITTTQVAVVLGLIVWSINS